MSRQYDAKQHAISAYPADRNKAVKLFLDYLDVSEGDFIYNEGISAEEYLFPNAPEEPRGPNQ